MAFRTLFRAFTVPLVASFVVLTALAGTALPARAQSFHFALRAEPEIIPANGISTASIFVQVPRNSLGNSISSVPTVRFATTGGVIESTAQLQSGVARVLLRSSTTPGTAVITAFVGSSREAVTVEFTSGETVAERYLELAAPYVAYGSDIGVATCAGKAALDFGDLHIESSTRMDVDLYSERVWAQGEVIIRGRSGKKTHELRGDRLFYDLRRRRGVIRRADTGQGEARQEFVGLDFAAPVGPVNPEGAPEEAPGKLPPSLLPERPTKTVPVPELGSGVQPGPGDVPLASGAAGPVPDPAEVFSGIGAADGGELGLGAGFSAGEPADADQPKTGLGRTKVTETLTTALVSMPRPESDGTDVIKNPPPFSALPEDSGARVRITELPPPQFNPIAGYWVAARRIRVFPRDKIQFERASIYFNGGKVFREPLYVLPLDGSFNPATDVLGFNSIGGVSLDFPVYYQATSGGTGAVYVRHDPSNGYSTRKPGFSLGLQHQYYFSSKANGKLTFDELGRGDWDMNLQHEMQFSPSLKSSIYVNSPRHQDLFTRADLTKELKSMQIGLETFYDRPESEEDSARGQFFVRLRPKNLGSGWSYTVGGNLLAVRTTSNVTVTSGGSSGLPGRGGDSSIRRITDTLYGQTLTASLQSPTFSPWRGSAFTANLFTTAFNYSDDRRGVSPGANLGFSQDLTKSFSIRLDYTYDRSSLGLYGATSGSFTHYVSAGTSAKLGSRLGLNTFLSKSLNDGSVYGSSDLSFDLSSKWRTGLFMDYNNFEGVDNTINYGWSLGRKIGQREFSLNYDASRGKFYFDLGGYFR